MTSDDELEQNPENGDFGELRGACPTFLFYREDRALIAQIVKAVRGILARPGLTPPQVHQTAAVLLALERLPLPTPGVAAELMLSIRNGKEMWFIRRRRR